MQKTNNKSKYFLNKHVYLGKEKSHFDSTSIQGNSGREPSPGTLDLDQFKVRQILNDFRNDLRGMIDIDESPCKSVTRLLLL